MANVTNSKDDFDTEVELILHDIAKEEGFDNYEVIQLPTRVKVKGYFSVVTAFTINGATTYGEQKSLHLVAKCAPKSDNIRSEVNINEMYVRESYFYNTVIPIFQQFEIDRAVQPFSSIPECYKTCIKEKREALIFENIVESGYSPWKTGIPMEDDHVNLVMKEYGRFHAVSLALKDQQPTAFEKLGEKLYYDMQFTLMAKCGFLGVYQKQCIKALNSLNAIDDTRAYNIFKTFTYEKVYNFLESLPTRRDDYCVVLHADAWSNNMMFKYEDTNNPKLPTKLCLFDFPVCKMGSPVLDLSYFLYACSSKNVIDRCKYYLDIYYNALSVHLQKLGTNPEKVYPYSVFKEHWKDYSKFGLITSMLLLHSMLTDEKDVSSFAELADLGITVRESYNYDISNMEEYNDRAKHIILHFVNNDLI